MTFAKLPLWSYFPIGLALLVAGLNAIGAVAGDSGEIGPKAELLRAAPLWVLVPVLVLVPIGEALLWTVAFTEAFAYKLRAPLLGAICGLFAYSVVFHAGQGALAVAASAWAGAVWGYLYVVMRTRSRWAAFINLVCLRWAFVALAYDSIG